MLYQLQDAQVKGAIMDSQTSTRQRLMKITFLFALGLSVFLFLSWLFNTSYISFEAPSGTQGSTKYELVNQKGKETISFESNEPSFKKRVPKASYEIKVVGDDKSYFEILKTKPFLQSSEVKFNLSPEKKREFIGNSPEACVYYDGSQAISYSCKNELSYMVSHVPATAETPTLTKSFDDDFGHLLAGGLVNWQGKKVLYAQGSGDLESTEQHSLLLEIDDSLNVLSSSEVEGLDTDEMNEIQPYKDGFLIYSKNFDQLRYYSNSTEEFETIKIDYPEDKKLQATSIDTFEDRIAAVYTDAEAAKKADADSGEPQPGKTMVKIHGSEKPKEFTFKEGVSSVKLCSKDYLCYINGGELSIYDIGGDKQKLMFKVTGVKSAFSADGKVIIERDKDILELDPKSKKGYAQYSFGDYTSCGAAPTDGKGYAVCVMNNKNNQSLLHVDGSAENTDSIDKKVLELLKQPFVTDVSAYKSFIYISPNVGGLVPDPASGQFTYDPAIKAEAAGAIDSFIKEIGLDTSIFNLINTNR
jgi:hypothetical protein